MIDVQPAFIPAVMDIMHVSDRIILLTTDTFSVVSRTVGMLDWAAANNFIELGKMVQIINMCTKKAPSASTWWGLRYLSFIQCRTSGT